MAHEDPASKTVKTKTFKVHSNQKETIDAALEKAREESGTAFDTVALDLICLDYLGTQSMKQKLQAMGIEKALQALDEAFPGVDITVEMEAEAA